MLQARLKWIRQTDMTYDGQGDIEMCIDDLFYDAL